MEDIVEARTNEILDNIANQIILSGYENNLMAGAILTGGASNINKLEEAFSKRTKIQKIRIAKETQYVIKGSELPKDGSYNTLMALLAAGKENCCLAIPEVITPEPIKEIGRKDIEGQLFTMDGESVEEIRKQEELQRQRAKEAALAAEKAAKEAAEIERKRKIECEELLKEAEGFKEDKKFKEALKRLSKAREMQIPEKEGAISTLEKEIKKLKEENSIGNKFAAIFNKILEED